MYRRKIENVFQSWLDNASHKPLVVKGVRQCGKTSSVVDFARTHFKHVVYLDFREHPDYKKFFTPNLWRWQQWCCPQPRERRLGRRVVKT